MKKFHNNKNVTNYSTRATEKANYEVEMKLVNLNVLDIFKGNHLDELLAIYKGHLWKDSSDVYVTRIVSPSDIGGRLPVDPRDKEG